MPVYVDNALIPYRGMLMSHMWADTQAELLQMADRIGVARKWLQDKRPDFVHFDISKGKRELALKCGAIETDRFGPAEHAARQRGDARMLRQIERLRERRAATRAHT